jgi:hypothetical protein
MANTRNFTHNSNFFFGTNLFGEETMFNIQTCNLPGLNFSHIQTGRQSSLLNFQGDTLTFNDLTVDIIVDEDLEIWKDIAGSMLKMRDAESGHGELIEKNSWLDIHDDNGKSVLKLRFKNCLIESIDDLAYNTNADDEIITVSVTIKYDYYEIIFK